jgi:hypothetical protein
MSETELAWLAGWLEGEGSFVVTSGKSPRNDKRYPRIRINATSTDLDVLEHVKTLAGGRINGPYKSSHAKGRVYYVWTLSTHRQCAPLLRALQPLMVASRRKTQVNKAIEAVETYVATPHGSKAL